MSNGNAPSNTFIGGCTLADHVQIVHPFMSKELPNPTFDQMSVSQIVPQNPCGSYIKEDGWKAI
jgi:hypothetical protein